MSQATLTPEAKSLLSATIRALRARLIDDLLQQATGDYRLAEPADKANLPGAQARSRAALDAFLDERMRATKPPTREAPAEARARLLREAVTETAATWLNRLVLLKHLEAMELSRPKVVTGGWESPGYRQFRPFAPALLSGNDTEGYALLLRLLFEEHATDLPGLFGEVGLERLFPLPAATLRELVERLDDPGLESAWTDDTTLGWVYQYWNDPEREALDKKISEGGKIEPGEIASKTQMFTERYMVEWLLHNSLGPTWLGLCEKNGWTADAHRVLPALEARRVAFRQKREAGLVPLDELMPIEEGLEDRWKYFVPQPLSPDAVARAPASLAELKLLDPACGSGHFLVIAFDLLTALYREEARHTGADITDKQIAERILENNLFGVDIDPRAVQIAAAALVLKARLLSRDARPARMNLVAPALRLGHLPPGDPAVVQLQQALLAECGIPLAASAALFKALAGVDHLGSLLKIDRSIDEALEEAGKTGQLFEDRPAAGSQTGLGSRVGILEKLEAFLAAHSNADDLGLRLDGEQLAQGVRFIRIVREDTYDIVVGNPPYQGTTKMADAAYVAAKYPRGKADLYAAFLERGLELAREGGCLALVTMRGWMFLGQFAALRARLLHESDLRIIGDVDRGAFDEVPNEVLAAAMVVARRAPLPAASSIAIQPTPLDDRSYDRQRTNRKRAALLAQVGRYEFDVRGFEAIEGEPVVYWWGKDFLARYAAAPKLGRVHKTRKGVVTSDDVRFDRMVWEASTARSSRNRWKPLVTGAKGAIWFEPLRFVINWLHGALELAVLADVSVSVRTREPSIHFKIGVAFSQIGNNFAARAHRFPSVVGNKGSSVFPANVGSALCTMNMSHSRFVLQSLNPGIGFELSDVNRLPIFPVENADEIYAALDRAFTEHEAAREASVEFRRPGPSPWRYAQDWAQRSVDRPAGEPLPPYTPAYDDASPPSQVAFAFGVALGRFGAGGEGVLHAAPAGALPAGILFLSARADEGGEDGLNHPACAPLHAAWAAHGAAAGEGADLRTYLRKGFFAYVKDTYENRPIYLPLSSRQRSFVAWVSIHRFQESGAGALPTLLADVLVPERRAIEAEVEELRKARGLAEGKQKAAAEKRFERMRKLGEELDEFLGKVAQGADKGPPRVDREPEREQDARYVMDLDDGVMVNAAALWSLLEPQWKDPKKWWKELASAQGRKDYDWSHLAARYFPARVAGKCEADPSLAVAHGCFWRLHPEKAYGWELRLQDEIRPDFTIDEPGSDEARAGFLGAHRERASEIASKERGRRERKAAKNGEESQELPGLDEVDEAAEGEGE